MGIGKKILRNSFCSQNMHITSVQVEDYFKHVNQKDDEQESTKKAIRECVNAINEVQLWDWLRNASGEELLFSPESKIIFDKNVECGGNDGHSGASWHITMQMTKFVLNHVS